MICPTPVASTYGLPEALDEVRAVPADQEGPEVAHLLHGDPHAPPKWQHHRGRRQLSAGPAQASLGVPKPREEVEVAQEAQHQLLGPPGPRERLALARGVQQSGAEELHVDGEATEAVIELLQEGWGGPRAPRGGGQAGEAHGAEEGAEGGGQPRAAAFRAKPRQEAMQFLGATRKALGVDVALLSRT